jgi:hypothetical protein
LRTRALQVNRMPAHQPDRRVSRARLAADTV